MSEGTLYQLPDEALIDALGAWGIASVLSLEPLSGGFSADVWKVELPGERTLVAKFAYETLAALETQLRTAEFLAERGLPVPKPVRTSSGDLCVMLEGPPANFHPLGLMTFIPGQAVETFDDEIQVTAGRMFARIHRAMQEADFVSRETKWFYQYLEDETEPIAHQELVRPITREALALVHEFEAQHPVTTGVIIADNLHLMRDSKTGAVGVVDLGHSILGPLAADVAITKLEIEHRGFSSDAFVNAYFADSNVTEQDLLALPAYARMRLASLLRFFAWRVFHGSAYEPTERERNHQRFWTVLQRLQQHP